MLPFYAARFSTTEINYTFYRVPNAKTLLGWVARTPAKFRFSLKAPRQITHTQKLAGSATSLKRFWKVAQKLGDKLGPTLFQLPPFLKKDLPRLENFLDSIPRGMKVAFEFRHASWFDDEIFAALKSHGAALCVADSEKLSTPPVMSSDFGYFRLRDQYDKKQLRRWAKIILKANEETKDLFIYFKHEETGSGPKFAAQLKELIQA